MNMWLAENLSNVHYAKVNNYIIANFYLFLFS